MVSDPQVKPGELTAFLQLKKSEGYCIVGVEQTANSQSLQDYQFPEKTLLLLGYDNMKHFCLTSQPCPGLSYIQHYRHKSKNKKTTHNQLHKYLQAYSFPCPCDS